MKRKKKELTKNGKQGKAFRREVTKHIAKAESRQEFEPLVGKIIDRAKVEPPHLKNSAWQLFVMKHALSLSDVSNSLKLFMASHQLQFSAGIIPVSGSLSKLLV